MPSRSGAIIDMPPHERGVPPPIRGSGGLAIPCVLLSLLIAACSGAPEPPAAPATGATPGSGALAARVNSYLAPYIEAGLFHGVVLIARGGEVLLHEAHGLADAEAGIPNALDTRFRIASLTKTFTSAAVIVLRDRGLLSFDDPLSKYVDGFPEGEKITIEHLLAHASGASNPDDFLGEKGEVPLADLVENIRSKPLLFEPGTESRYSNAGYNLLAFVIEKVTGSTYDGFLHETFFDPLGMQDTGHFGADEAAPRFARGHTPGPGSPGLLRTPLSHVSAFLGAGSLSSTAADLHRWARAVAREEIFSLDGLRWPYGWGKIETDGHKGISQTGANTGFVSSLTVFPEEEVYVVCLNDVEAGMWTQWANDLASIAFDRPVATPVLPAEVPVDQATLDSYEGVYRAEDGNTYRAVNEGGLFIHWNDRKVGKYLTPLGEGRFQPRSDAGVIRFENDATGRPVRLVWDFGESSLVFDRVP